MIESWKFKLEAMADFARYAFLGIVIIGIIVFCAVLLAVTVSNFAQIYL